MIYRRFPDPSLDGTVWGASPYLAKGPDIRFFCCNPAKPRTPSHVWWDGVAFAVDQAIFERAPEMVQRHDGYLRSSFGALELIWDGATSLTLEDLERAQAAAQADAAGSTT